MDAEGTVGTRRLRRWYVVLAVIVAAQIAVPTIAALQPPPTRLGWQMYSGVGDLPSISLTRADGSGLGVSLHDVIAKGRPELDWNTYLPPYLCAQHPDATGGTLSYDTSQFEFRC